MELEEYKISQSQGPFEFHTWIELSFPLAIDIKHTFEATYVEGIKVQVNLELGSDYYKVVTSNRWQFEQDLKRWVEQIQKGADQTRPPMSMPAYILEQDLDIFVESLKNFNPEYVHVEKVPAVAHISTKIPAEIVPEKEFVPYKLSPENKFFSREIASSISSLLDAYRISAFPWMRYTITPVSEALGDLAYVEILGGSGEIVTNWYYGYDAGSPSHVNHLPLEARKEIENRFNFILSTLSMVQTENQIATAYYLFRMQKWAEAVAVASAVVDNLQRKLVFRLSKTDTEAEKIWKDNRNRYKNLFNQEFPALGIPKLSNVDQRLWQSFVDAKDYRGAAAHGQFPSITDQEREEVRQHLKAFDDVSRWLKGQLGSTWELDAFAEGQQLEPFP